MRVKRPLILLMCLAAALALPRMASSQSINEFEIKAVFIYNFTQFIQWPESSFENSEDPFVIGVLGKNVFGKYLEEAVAGESYQSRRIVIKYYSNMKDIEDCHILYVGSLTGAIKPLRGRHVLTIGEKKDFMEQGGSLRFYDEGNKVRIEINQSAASDAGLIISSKLLRLATIYKVK